MFFLLFSPFLFPFPSPFIPNPGFSGLPPPELLGWVPVLMRISEIAEEACRFCGARFVPLCGRSLEAEKERGTAALFPDGVHLTPAGARLPAEEWLTAALPLLS